ncbi:MAG: hypothetical protein ACREB3_16285 [Burkholderiales bacterium]
MTTVKIELPDSLAEEAQQAGLLSTEAVEAILREQLRIRHIAELRDAIGRMVGAEGAPMTMREIEAEVQAYRKERRLASGA